MFIPSVHRCRKCGKMVEFFSSVSRCRVCGFWLMVQDSTGSLVIIVE